MIISCIAAVSENNVIGKDLSLPWRLSSDLKRFKSITMGHHIVLGRKNFESIGRALPGRVNCVLSRNSDFRISGVELFSSLESALAFAKNAKEKECFIIGGAEIYKQALPFCSRLYLTKVLAVVEGNVYFPPIPEDFKMLSEEHFKADEKNEYDTTFCIMERILK